jgi:hypothetical protein
MSRRTYSREEIAALMERAAELQAQRPDRSGEDGLTLDELEAVAASSGIDPYALRQAAGEMDRPRHESGGDALSTKLVAERFVALPSLGDRLPDQVVEDVSADLRLRYGTTSDPVMRALGYGIGQIERIGRTLEWRHTSAMGITTTLQLRPRNGGIHLRLSETVGWAAPGAESVAYAVAPAVLTALVALVVTKTPFVVLGIFVLSMAGFSLLIRNLIVDWREKRNRSLDALADDLTRTIVEATPEPQAEAAPSPLLDDLDAFDPSDNPQRGEASGSARTGA